MVGTPAEILEPEAVLIAHQQNALRFQMLPAGCQKLPRPFGTVLQLIDQDDAIVPLLRGQPEQILLLEFEPLVPRIALPAGCRPSGVGLERGHPGAALGQAARERAEARPRLQDMPLRPEGIPAQQRGAQGTEVIKQFPLVPVGNDLVILVGAVVRNNRRDFLFDDVRILCHRASSIAFAILWFSISFRCEGIAPYS